jgi:CRISPR-associated protein Csa1
MYLLSADERRYVQRGLLPEARRQPVADELRGWSWPQPPLKPVYSQPLGVYEIAGKYCPTGRDVFLRRVLHTVARPSPVMEQGRRIHQVVADVFSDAKRLVYQYGSSCIPHLERLVESASLAPGREPLAEAVRAFEAHRIVERVEEVLALHRYVHPDALVALALPVHTELRLNGRYLGLSEHLAVDAVTFPEALILDLKLGNREPFHRLTTTGYALVMESLFEVPVDIGCIVYARIEDGRVRLERDFHVIGDDLRQTFIEEREDKMRLVEHEVDPGLPEHCPSTCPYLAVCHPAENRLPAVRQDTRSANPSAEPLPEVAIAV